MHHPMMDFPPDFGMPIGMPPYMGATGGCPAYPAAPAMPTGPVHPPNAPLFPPPFGVLSGGGSVLSTQPDRHNPAHYDPALGVPEFSDHVWEVVRQHGLLAQSDLQLPPHLAALLPSGGPPPPMLPGAMPPGVDLPHGAPGLEAPEGPFPRPTLLSPPPPQTPPPNVPPKVPTGLPRCVLEAFPPLFESGGTNTRSGKGGPPGNLDISSAWKEIREMLDATKTHDSEAEAKASASAYLLSLVKGGPNGQQQLQKSTSAAHDQEPGSELLALLNSGSGSKIGHGAGSNGNSSNNINSHAHNSAGNISSSDGAAGQKTLCAAMLLDEGILEAKLFEDGYHYVKVDGQWLGESSRYYCRHCKYWSNSMEAHMTTPHHQRNRMRGPPVAAPNNARRASWGSETTKESTSSVIAALANRSDATVAGPSGWWNKNIAKPAAAADSPMAGPSPVPSPSQAPTLPPSQPPVVQIDILHELLGKDVEDAVPGGPGKPPSPWHLAWSQEHGAYYYWHGETRAVQWEAPLSG